MHIKVYHQYGYLTVHPDSGKLVIDPSKTLSVLDDFAACFLKLLDAMDAGDGETLETILLDTMAPEDDFVNQTLSLVRAA